MPPAHTVHARLRSRLIAASASRYTAEVPGISAPALISPLRTPWSLYRSTVKTSLGFPHPKSLEPIERLGLRRFAAEAKSDSPSTSISFEPQEVSRQLVALAEKYCKEGTTISLSHKFDVLETREERPWDCLDTVEFVLDAEGIYDIVIPDEDADSFECIQDVVDYIVKVGTERAKTGQFKAS
ncbi:acyl carrier related protein [Cyclospora cayetanensis]|uniref:Acyl carrier related protein n=1 Tax=Cyclospora cayetanensis TaxID=88456 RepID=A0A1D3CYF0_9EIME|nr:acyl carrier related protein [Cyclospora cayetanensis]